MYLKLFFIIMVIALRLRKVKWQMKGLLNLLFIWNYWFCRQELVTSVLRCLHALAYCYSLRKNKLGSLITVSCQQLWKNIWISVSRMVSAKQHIDLGNSLLAELLRVRITIFSLLYFLILSCFMFMFFVFN